MKEPTARPAFLCLLKKTLMYGSKEIWSRFCRFFIKNDKKNVKQHFLSYDPCKSRSNSIGLPSAATLLPDYYLINSRNFPTFVNQSLNEIQ